eukprot:tig00020608_g11925.t1
MAAVRGVLAAVGVPTAPPATYAASSAKSKDRKLKKGIDADESREARLESLDALRSAKGAALLAKARRQLITDVAADAAPDSELATVSEFIQTERLQADVMEAEATLEVRKRALEEAAERTRRRRWDIGPTGEVMPAPAAGPVRPQRAPPARKQRWDVGPDAAQISAFLAGNPDAEERRRWFEDQKSVKIQGAYSKALKDIQRRFGNNDEALGSFAEIAISRYHAAKGVPGQIIANVPARLLRDYFSGDGPDIDFWRFVDA